MMADRSLVLHIAINNFFLDDDDEYHYVEYCTRTLLLAASTYTKRQHIPRICGYAENVVPSFTFDDFRYHFRITKGMFEEILRVIAPVLLSEHGGGTEDTEPGKQLLLFVCYLSNQESMREISFHFGLSISTVHSVIKRVNKAIVEKLANVIQWPDFPAQRETARELQLQSGLPGIIGALDGTHIRLAAAPKGDSDYINRKKFPSMQLQIVTDNTLLIRDAYTGWPGCTHNSRVLRNSSLFAKGNQGNIFDQDKYLIADSAYPLKTWPITPFRDNGHLNAQERRFNRVLSGTRQIVERCIGHLKGRFRRLREITVHGSEDIVLTIMSGCILHNMCIINEDSVEDFIEVDNDAHPNNYPNIGRDGQDGIARRLQLMQELP